MNLTAVLHRARAALTGASAPAAFTTASPPPQAGEAVDGASLWPLLMGGWLDPTRPVLLTGPAEGGKTTGLSDLIRCAKKPELYVAALSGQTRPFFGSASHLTAQRDVALQQVTAALEVMEARRAKVESAADARNRLILAVEDLPSLLGSPCDAGGAIGQVACYQCDLETLVRLDDLLTLGPGLGCVVYATTPRLADVPQRILDRFQVVRVSYPQLPQQINDTGAAVDQELGRQ